MQVARLYDFGDIRVEETARPAGRTQRYPGADPRLRHLLGRHHAVVHPAQGPAVLGHEPVGVVEETGSAVLNSSPVIGSSCIIMRPASVAMPAAVDITCTARPGARRASHPAGWPSTSRPRDESPRHAAPAAVGERRGRRAGRAGGVRGQVDAPLGAQTRRFDPDHRARHHGRDARADRTRAGRRDDHRRGLHRAAGQARHRTRRRRRIGGRRRQSCGAGARSDQGRDGRRGDSRAGHAAAIATGVAAAASGGTVVEFTSTAPDEELTLRPFDLYFREINLVPSYSCGPDDTRQALAMIERGVLRAADLVTHRFPLANSRGLRDRAKARSTQGHRDLRDRDARSFTRRVARRESLNAAIFPACGHRRTQPRESEAKLKGARFHEHPVRQTN